VLDVSKSQLSKLKMQLATMDKITAIRQFMSSFFLRLEFAQESYHAHELIRIKQ
jgi:hypothetical protein